MAEEMNKTLTPTDPMYQMLYVQCPSHSEGALKTYSFELCDGMMEIKGEWNIWPEMFFIKSMSMRWTYSDPKDDVTTYFIQEESNV